MRCSAEGWGGEGSRGGVGGWVDLIFIVINTCYQYLIRISGVLWLRVGVYVQGLILCWGGQWDYMLLMSSQIKTHRRNRADEHEDYRFSIPVHKLELNRPSFQPRYNNALTFRSSDISKYGFETRLTKKLIGVNQVTSAKSIAGKAQSTLLVTLRNLQSKLVQAKKQFWVQEQKEQNVSNFELNSYQESSSGASKWIQQSLLQKLEESTINLESQKKLINAVKSKERIIWAQKIKTYYLSELAKAIAGINERANQHLTISLQILKSCMLLSLPNLVAEKMLDLPMSKHNQGKKTLVLDLDETLFHCSQERNSPQDIQINLALDSTVQRGYVSLRPFAISFLKRMKKHFQIMVFTASEKSYADAILNQIDPQYQLIEHRLYRQHCVKLNSKIYAKDLRIIGRDLSQIVLVDNSPFSYLYQLANGIPILPYYFGEDNELVNLERYLQQLRKVQDVRKMNRDTFKLHRYIEFEDCEELVKELYCSGY